MLQRVGRPVEEAELDPIADRKLQLAVVLVVVVLSVLPGLEKTLADVGEEGVAITKERVDRLRLSRARGMWKQCRRRPTVDDLEGSHTESRVEGVVAVLRPSQPVDLGVWVIARSTP